jgi:putative ABC transport system permease protein
MNIRESIARLAGLLLRRRPAAAFDDEMRFHIQMAEDEFRRRGMSADAAHRAAMSQFGGVSRTVEAYSDQQSIPHVERLLQDARYGLRSLLRTPGFTIAALLTLALGIGANVAIFSVVHAVLLRPLPYASPERLAMLGDRTPAEDVSNIGFATLQDLRDRNRTFASIAAIRSWAVTLVSADGAELVPGMRVSWNFFEILGVNPALGRNFRPADDTQAGRRVVLLSDRLWRTRFGGDPGVVGRRLRFDDVEFEVVGVMPADFEPLISTRYYQPAQIWAPLGYDTTLSYACRSCEHLKALGRIKPGTSISQAAADLNAIRQQLVAEHPSDYPNGEFGVGALSDILAGPVRPALLVLLGAVAFVLLIACANVANLLLARAMNRSREMAVRAALGASRRRLIRQMLTESTMLSVLGGALGTALAAALLRSLAQIAPVTLPRAGIVGIDTAVLAFALGLSLATGIVFGLFPALRVSSPRPGAALGNDRRTTSGSMGVRNVLVVADVALALVLLTGAGLMLRTVGRLVHTNPGFDARNVFTFQVSPGGTAYREDAAVVAFQGRLLERLRALPGVESAALAGQIPMGGNGDRWGFHIEGREPANPAESPSAERYSITPDYFGVMRIALLRGRGIVDSDTSRTMPVIVISETAAQLWGGEDPLGRRVRIGGPDSPWKTVVGIVGDVRHAQLNEPPRPQMYLPQQQVTDSFLVAAVRTRTERPEVLAASVRSVIRELDPSVPLFGIATLEDLVDQSFDDRRFVMRILASFAAIALLLAGIGLYGVIAFVVAQRTREVGVRVALGAKPRDIIRLVLGTGLKSVTLGLLIGIAGAALLTSALESLLFGVPRTDPLSLGTSIAVLAAVAIVAHVVPALRALRVDPAIALRAD